MRIALLADIHANLEALTACLGDARERGFDRMVFLGDIVGYGADPAPCVEIVAEACAKGALALAGNHDKAVSGPDIGVDGPAAEAIRWTRTVLGEAQRNFLDRLPMTLEEEDRLYVHASAHLLDVFPYIQEARDAARSLAATPAWLTVVGHVHRPALYNMTSVGKVMGFVPPADTETPIPLLSQRRWVAVMGAVGQPRDGNPAAAYGLLDTDARSISYLRVPYDVEAAAAKIRAAGLPQALWQRLAVGR